MRKRKLCSAAALLLSASLLSTPALAAGDTGFSDVPASAWYADAAAFCQSTGLMNGTSDTTFSPNSPMTRAMLVTVLHRLSGSPAAGGESGFSDVPAGAWMDAGVSWAVQMGIANGYGGGTFGANDPVTREQLAVLLWRYSGSPACRAGEDFADEGQIASYAADAVDWARAYGIITGLDGNLFAPQSQADRAQVATILMRYVETYQPQPAIPAQASVMDVMCQPSGIAAMEDGSLLIADTYYKLIWQVKDGETTVYAGGETAADPYGEPQGGYNDAALENSYFQEPWAIAPFLDGWAVSDAGNDVVRLVGTEITQTVNSRTSERLTLSGTGVAFSRPTGLAADEDGNLYVSDTLAGAVRKIDPKGKLTTVVSGLKDPMGLCWKDGVLYIAETGDHQVLQVKNGQLSVVAGSGAEGLTDGPAAMAAFASPQGVAVGDDGTIYVADTCNGAIRQIRNGVVATLAIQDKSGLDSFPISPVGLLIQGDTLYACDVFSCKVFVIELD